MSTEYQMFIGGSWTDGSSPERLPSVNPYDQEPWASIPQASQEDVDRAVRAAQEAFESGWRETNGLQRATLIGRLADLLDADASRMALLESTDNGKVIRETESQMHFAARMYRFFAGYADKLYGEVIPLDNTKLFDYTIREPLGAVALLTAWNSPMSLLSNKLAPALATGNCVVIKPSEEASATTLEFGKLVEQAGFPDGVVNIVTGDWQVGELLTKSNVDKISFTGSPSTGRVVARNASENLVPVTLELGGKSPNIILEDADLGQAIPGAMAGIFAATGQTCIAGSRLLVQDAIHDQVVDEISRRAQQIRLGNPVDPATEMGTAANERQYNRVLQLIASGAEEGAEVVTGGKPARHDELGRGFFIEPTVFSHVDNQMTIAQEEIFGPVLSVISFKEPEEAVRIANDTKYGLASGLWTQDPSKALWISGQIRAGTVWVNTYRNIAAQAPFGGVRQSGYGRERGWHALLEYTTIKNVMIDYSGEQRDPFAIRT